MEERVGNEGKAQPEATQSSSSQGPEMQGFTALIDLKFVSVSETEVVAELPVSAKHHQPMGIVHGGVYCSIVETLCSVGAHLNASKWGLFVVGVDNQTSFLKATRTGTLRAVAKPLAVGKRTQLWEAQIHNEQGQLAATGRVRLIALEADKNLAGQAAGTLPSK